MTAVSLFSGAGGLDLGLIRTWRLVNMVDYVVPQNRPRVIFVGAWYTYGHLLGSDLRSSLAVGSAGRADWTYSESLTDAYGYNDRNELIYSRRVAESAEDEYAYQYDDIGNRLSSLNLGTNLTYTANALNQYTSISNSALSASLREIFIPQYDLDGNQTFIKTSTGIWSVAYNGENRPVNWTCGSTNIVMKFDRMGRRVEYLETVTDTTGGAQSSATVTNAHHRFVYDGYLCIQRLNAASNNTLDLAFGWDPTEPVATRPLLQTRQGGGARGA